jgi:hypothetical protein
MTQRTPLDRVLLTSSRRGAVSRLLLCSTAMPERYHHRSGGTTGTSIQ